MTAARPIALVTGASRGIGRELARLLGADGHDLILVGRDAAALGEVAEELRDLHGAAVRIESRDLSAPGAAAALWIDLASSGVEVDVLVNNAGAGLYGKLQDQDPDALERTLQLNIVSLAALTRLALPPMVARGRGHVLNVASVVGFQPSGPRMAAYFAAKAFVLSFTRSVAAELEGTGVAITALAPGLTESSFEERSGAGRSNLYKYLPKEKAERVARAGYEAMKRGSRIAIPGALTRLLAFAGELPPRAIAAAVNRFLLSEATP